MFQQFPSATRLPGRLRADGDDRLAAPPLDEPGILQREALQGAIVLVYYNPGDTAVPMQHRIQRSAGPR